MLYLKGSCRLRSSILHSASFYIQTCSMQETIYQFREQNRHSSKPLDTGGEFNILKAQRDVQLRRSPTNRTLLGRNNKCKSKPRTGYSLYNDNSGQRAIQRWNSHNTLTQSQNFIENLVSKEAWGTHYCSIHIKPVRHLTCSFWTDQSGKREEN